MANKNNRSVILISFFVSSWFYVADRSRCVEKSHMRVFTHSIIVLPMRRNRSEHIHRMIRNSILRHHPPPVCNVGIIPEREYARISHFRWEQPRRPRRCCALCSPCLFAIAGQAVHEDDAVIFERRLDEQFLATKPHVLEPCRLYKNEKIEIEGGKLTRGYCFHRCGGP